MDQAVASNNRWRRLGDVLFDMALYPVSGVAFWLWIQDPIARAGAEFQLLMANTLYVYAVHRDPRYTQGFVQVGMIFAAGIVLMVIGLALEPVWGEATALFLSGKVQAASMVLDARSPTGVYGLPFLGGVMAIYWACVSFVRVTLMRLGLIASPFKFPWARAIGIQGD